jgi:hypothetical protein
MNGEYVKSGSCPKRKYVICEEKVLEHQLEYYDLGIFGLNLNNNNDRVLIANSMQKRTVLKEK